MRAVRVIESLPRQLLGLAALRVEVIGHAKEQAAAQTLFPLLRRATRSSRSCASCCPRWPTRSTGSPPPPPRALRRYVLPPLAADRAAGRGGRARDREPVAAAGSRRSAPPTARSRFRAAGWRLEGGRLAVRSRRLARSTVLAPAAGRESQDLDQTALQRRARLADVAVAFGKGTIAQIRHLDADVARGLWAAIGPR